jgi:hypothetical protein
VGWTNGTTSQAPGRNPVNNYYRTQQRTRETGEQILWILRYRHCDQGYRTTPRRLPQQFVNENFQYLLALAIMPRASLQQMAQDSELP